MFATYPYTVISLTFFSKLNVERVYISWKALYFLLESESINTPFYI